MRHHKFKIDFMNNILNKNNDEKKQTVLTGDSNLKLIKFSKSRDVNQFLEKMFCQNLISQKTLPTRVSAKAATLTRNCFSRNKTLGKHAPYKEIVKKIIQANWKHW